MNRRRQLGGGASMVLLAMVLSACTIVGQQRVFGWPRMEVVARYVPAQEMRSRCAP